MSYTRQQWASDFLAAIGNTAPDPLVINWVVGWTRYETSAGAGAAYNLLNTTQTEPGSTPFNSVGVQNFTSYTQGVQANAHVLENGLYPDLLAALAHNDVAELSAPSAAIRNELSTWGTGYKNWGFSAAGANDSFSGDSW